MIRQKDEEGRDMIGIDLSDLNKLGEMVETLDLPKIMALLTLLKDVHAAVDKAGSLAMKRFILLSADKIRAEEGTGEGTDAPSASTVMPTGESGAEALARALAMADLSKEKVH